MTDQKFLGKWAGEYIYGEDYPPSIRGKKVAFEIDFTFANGLLKGHCTDEEATPHFKLPATIEGTVCDNCISFVKRYPYYWQNEEATGPRFIPKLPSQEINYSGNFQDGQFEGEWEIVTIFFDAQGEPFAYKGNGYWHMKKAG
jgi:hypothetical protein